jgi:hypothetical protein
MNEGHGVSTLTWIAVAVDAWLFDALAAFGTELEDLEPEPDKKNDPGEDGEVGGHRSMQ